MEELSGKISDRIRSGEIPADALPSKRPPADDRPSDEAVRGARGRSLGNPARSDRTAETHDS
jgi:hypothetical protein